MSYFGRDIFPFWINHAEPWSGSIDYDPGLDELGNVGAVALGTEELTRDIKTIQAVAENLEDLQDWITSVLAIGSGFWLPLVNASMAIVSGIDTSHFIARGSELAESWGRCPAQHLWIVSPDGVGTARRVEEVIVSGGNSLITLDVYDEEEDEDATFAADRIALSEVPDASWSVSRLIYCRATTNAPEITLIAGWYQFELQVKELPFEYGATAAATTEFYLYQFGRICGGNEAWEYFTNWGSPVIGDDGIWMPAPIEHGDVQEDSEGAQTNITVIPWAGCPLLDLYPTWEGLPLYLRIYEAYWDFDAKAETGTRQLLFDGEIRRPSPDGNRLVASAQSGADLNQRPIPAVPESRTCTCNFCSAACSLSLSDFSIRGTVLSSTSGSLYYIDVQLDQALPTDGWLDFGVIGSSDYYTSTPSKYWEVRSVQAVEALGDNQYRIQVPIEFYFLSIGDVCYVSAGCNFTPDACRSRTKANGTVVDNHQNYQGDEEIPMSNPLMNTAVYESSTKK